jgi:hypothetical protein
MNERLVSASDVEVVLRSRALDVPGKKGRRKVIDHVRGRRITVVYKETTNSILVVSVI